MTVFTFPGVQISTAGIATEAKQDTIITALSDVNTELNSQTALLTTMDADTGNIVTSASSIDAKTPALGQALAAASVPVVLTAAQISTLTPLSTVAATQSGTWNITNVSGTVSLPTGAATETTLAAASAKLPATLGSKAALASLAVTDSTEDIARIGIITETAPASDTASSGLNGRLQRIAQRLTSLIALIPTSLGQKTMANSLAVTLASDQTVIPASQSGTWTVQPGNTANTTAWLVRQVGKSVVTTVRNDYSSVNVTTGAWVQLVASTSAVVTEIDIFDSSGATLELGTGAAASETRLIIITPGGNGKLNVAIPASTRVSVRAISGTASVGELDINLFGV